MDRQEIEEQYKWDLTPIYKSIDEFNKEYDNISKKINNFKKYEKTMLNKANTFYETINEYFNISRILEKLSVYANLLFDEDTGNNQNQALSAKVSNLFDNFSKISYFVTPNILKKDYSEIEKYYKEEPKLKDYEIIIKNEYRYKEHTLSDIEEKLLSSITKMLNNNYETYELLKDSDITFGNIHDEKGNTVELTCSNYSVFIESENREVRKEAFITLYKTYKQFINTFASTLSGNIKENITIAKLKKFNSTIEWCLYPDEVDISVYNNLIDTINNNMTINLMISSKILSS